MNMYQIVGLVFFSSIAYGAENIPDFFHICRKSDPHLVDCIMKSIDKVRPVLFKGVPEYDIPSLEPLNVGELVLTDGQDINGLHITAKNVKAYRASDFKLKRLQVIKYRERYDLDILLPKINVEGIYSVRGQVLLLPIRGTGPFIGNFTDCSANVEIHMGQQEIKDNAFVTIKKIDIKLKIGKGYFKLNNLFNGDKVLGDVINNVINENFDIIGKDLIPFIERALQKTFKKFANKLCSRFTYNQLFPY